MTQTVVYQANKRVRSHEDERGEILMKLHARDRVQAVIFAYESGLPRVR